MQIIKLKSSMKFSDYFINLVMRMIDFDENKRFDFNKLAGLILNNSNNNINDMNTYNSNKENSYHSNIK